MKKFIEFCNINSCLFCPIMLMFIGKSVIRCLFESGEEAVNISENRLASLKIDINLCTLCKQNLRLLIQLGITVRKLKTVYLL